MKVEVLASVMNTTLPDSSNLSLRMAKLTAP